MIVECPYLRYCFSMYNFQATAKKSICLFVRILVHKVRALMSQAFAYKNYYITKRYIRCHVNKVLQKAPGLHKADFYRRSLRRNRRFYQEPLFLQLRHNYKNPDHVLMDKALKPEQEGDIVYPLPHQP